MEQALGKALNQQITLEAGPAYQAFEQAFASISKTRQDSLLVGLVMNGLAASATRANKAASRAFSAGTTCSRRETVAIEIAHTTDQRTPDRELILQ